MAKKRINKKHAINIMNELITRLVFEPKVKLHITGSMGRDEKVIHDIDFILITDKPILHIDLLLDHKNVINNIKIISFGEHIIKMNVYAYNKKFKVDFFITTKKELPFAEFQYDYRKSYVIRIRAYAKRKGYVLNQYGLYKNGKSVFKKVNHIHLIQIVNFLGLHYYDRRVAK
jgi:DNA polymerase/3'-5' exonuclease PolX